MKHVPLALIALSLLAAGCSKKKSDKLDQASAPTLAALAVPATETLSVPGFGDAVVSTPTGATRPMPVVVAVLGIGDTPELQCQNWRDLVGTRAFVLCPRGLPHMVQAEGSSDAGGGVTAPEADPDQPQAPPAETAAIAAPHQEGFYPSDVASLDREVSAGLTALAKRYGAHVSDSRLYAGFSRGAFLGASFVGAHPDKYGRAVLIEGGHTPWTDASAKQFAQAGGKKILFACGQQSCVDDANAASAILMKNGIDTRVVYGAGEGHGYKKQVKDEVKKTLDWVVEGDPTWRVQMASL